MVSKRISKPYTLSITSSLLATCLILCAILLFPFARDVLLHDYALHRYSQVFQRINHPANTSPVFYKKYVGLISGNGNHCNYFVGELRRYSGDRQAISSFYAGQDYTGLGDGLMFIENGKFPAAGRNWLPPDLAVLSAWLGSPDEPRDQPYLVYTFHLDLDPVLELRCS